MPRHARARRSLITRRGFVTAGASAVLTAGAWKRVLGANERIGVGIIGYGLIGKRHVIDFQEQSDVELIAIAEAHRGRLDEGAGFIGGRVRSYADFRQLLDDPRVNAVVISTPDHWHALMAMLACAAGKDVYVEKPLTLFVREGRWMLNAARKFNRVVQVGTQQRSGRHYQQARDLVRNGHLGKIVSVRMGAYRNILPGYGNPPDQDPPPEIDWNAWLGPAPMHQYNPNRCIYHFRWFWDYSGGQMTNLAAHSIDIVHWYLDANTPTAVTSAGGRYCVEDNGETPDTQDAIIEYPGWTASWSHREGCQGRSETGGLEFLGTRGSLLISRSGFKITPELQRHPSNTVPQFTGAHPVGGPQTVPEPATPQYRTAAVENPRGDSREQFKLHVRNFLDCIKSRGTPLSDLESSHRVATACHLANISLRVGRKLRWDAQQEQVVGDTEAAAMLDRPYRQPWDAELRALGVTG